MTDKTVIEPVPDTINYAYWALLVAAVGALVSPLVLLTQRTWLEHNIDKSARDEKKPVIHTAAELHTLATSSMRISVITGVVVAGLLVVFAYRIRKGDTRFRLALYGLYLLMALGNFSLVGVFSVVGIASSVPGLLKTVSFIGAVAMLAGVVLTTLPASRSFFVRNRAVRPSLESRSGAGANADRAGGPRQSLLGSLFAPRPSAARPNLTKTAGTKPATTRPAGSKTSTPSSGQPMRRGKAKARTTVEAGPAGAAAGGKNSKAKGR